MPKSTLSALSILFLLATAAIDASTPTPNQQPAARAKLVPLVSWKAHADEVFSVQYSPDRQRIATGSRDKTAAIWDAGTGKRLLHLQGFVGPVLGLAFHPNGKHLATAEGLNPPFWNLPADKIKGEVTVWDVRTGKVTLRFDTKDAVYNLAYSPRGSEIATAGASVKQEESGLKVWDARTGKRWPGFRKGLGTVKSIAWSSDGRRLAAGDLGKLGVTVWELATGKRVVTFHEGWGFLALAWSPAGRQLAAAGVRGRTPVVWVWDVASQERVVWQAYRRCLRALVFTPDGRRLIAAAVGLDGKLAPSQGQAEVRITDSVTWDARLVLQTSKEDGVINCVCLSPDGSRLVSGHRDGTVKVWLVKDLFDK